MGADLVDPSQITVLERWTDEASLMRFRGDGPSDDQRTQIHSATVRTYAVTAEAA